MGPLKDIKVIEFSGIGPGPYCGMLLADLGADVIRVSRKDAEGLENKYLFSNPSASFLLTLITSAPKSANNIPQ